MVWWRAGTVLSRYAQWRGAVELEVRLEVPADGDRAEVVRAVAYPALVGDPVPGDRVLLNVNALELGLGTGGYAFVVALPDRLPADPANIALPDRLPADTPGRGQIVKARYAPMQVLLDAPPTDDASDDLDGMPVVTADLHSAVPAILAGVLATRPGTRVGYVMSEGGAQVAWFSRTLDRLAALLAGTVTIGQAFGGDLEATNVYSGLLAARAALRAQVVIVAPGPGNLGTATTWGFAGTSAGEAINAAAVLGGRPVGALRISSADPRPRHRGLSHHSLTAYGRVALAPADLVLPAGLPADLVELIRPAVATLSPPHRVVEVPVDGLLDALRALPLRPDSMGRDLADDSAYFLAAAAAGRHAAHLILPSI